MHIMLKNYSRRENHSSSSKTQSESTESVACDSNVNIALAACRIAGVGESTIHLETVCVCEALVFWSFRGGARANFPKSGW